MCLPFLNLSARYDALLCLVCCLCWRCKYWLVSRGTSASLIIVECGDNHGCVTSPLEGLSFSVFLITWVHCKLLCFDKRTNLTRYKQRIFYKVPFLFAYPPTQNYICSSILYPQSCSCIIQVIHSLQSTSKITNYVALVRERTITTEPQQLVGKVSANFYG
jgi:hypothetical protein